MPTPSERARPVVTARRAGATQPPQPGASRLDLYHMLSAVVGAYVGLVFYSLITPGLVPHPVAARTPDPRGALTLVHLAARPTPDGFYHVVGAVHNARSQRCRIATITVRFFDRVDREVTQTMTTLEDLPPMGDKPFEVHAMAQGATHFEAVADLAQF